MLEHTNESWLGRVEGDLAGLATRAWFERETDHDRARVVEGRDEQLGGVLPGTALLPRVDRDASRGRLLEEALERHFMPQVGGHQHKDPVVGLRTRLSKAFRDVPSTQDGRRPGPVRCDGRADKGEERGDLIGARTQLAYLRFLFPDALRKKIPHGRGGVLAGLPRRYMDKPRSLQFGESPVDLRGGDPREFADPPRLACPKLKKGEIGACSIQREPKAPQLRKGSG